jgi:hypothetical protein
MAGGLAQAGFLLGTLCRVGTAIIFAESAWHALRDPVRHVGVVANFKLLPGWTVPAAAWALPLLSAVAALLLPWYATARAGSVLGLVLMMLFTAAIFINVRRGRVHIDCGCGGAGGQHISAALVGRNLVLLVLLCAGLVLPVAGTVDAAAIVLTLGGAAGIASLYFAAGQLLANQAALRAEAVRA